MQSHLSLLKVLEGGRTFHEDHIVFKSFVDKGLKQESCREKKFLVVP